VLLYQAIRWPGRPGFALSRVLAIVGFLAVFGTVDETHQAFIPGRSMEAMDAVGDTAGAAVGAMAGAWWAGRRTRPVVSSAGGPRDFEVS
jgi:VanZ family protein